MNHLTITLFAKHQIDILTDGAKYICQVRHPEYHSIIYSTPAVTLKAEAIILAKRWVHNESPQAYRSRKQFKFL